MESLPMREGDEVYRGRCLSSGQYSGVARTAAGAVCQARLSGVASSAGKGRARQRARHQTCRLLSERSERSERSESGGTPLAEQHSEVGASAPTTPEERLAHRARRSFDTAVRSSTRAKTTQAAACVVQQMRARG
jgi:hypothetical protein